MLELPSIHTIDTMVSMNLELKRRHLPKQLIFISLVITALLSSLLRLHDLRQYELSSSFVDSDVATLLPLLISSPAVVSTSLAFKQSYGLFNDIPDQRWELMRQRAHEEHTFGQKDPSSMLKIQFGDFMNNLEVRKWTGDTSYSQHLRSIDCKRHLTLAPELEQKA
jgi:hypothetical protein